MSSRVRMTVDFIVLRLYLPRIVAASLAVNMYAHRRIGIRPSWCKLPRRILRDQNNLLAHYCWNNSINAESCRGALQIIIAAIPETDSQ